MKCVQIIRKIFVFSCVLLFIALNQDFLDHLIHRLFNVKKQNIPAFDNTQLVEQKCKGTKTILYGIFSTVDSYKKRMILRMKKRCDFDNENQSTIFVLGRPETRYAYEQLLTESLVYKDIFVLNCRENMNEGKTFQYFYDSFTQLPCFQYYAKIDDDTAFRPNELREYVSQFSNMSKVHLGRTANNEDTVWFRYLIKLIIFRRDMSWLFNLKSYHAGMLYVISKSSVKAWIKMRPSELYGDEDMRTSYYMSKVNSTMVNADTKFHHYIYYDDDQKFNQLSLFMENTTTPTPKLDWKQFITKESLAVHLCKTPEKLSTAFDQLC